jgi:Pro-kumamolisin, activation domain
MVSSRTVWASIHAGAIVFAMGMAQASPGQALRNHVPQAVRESRRLGSLSRTARLDLAIGLPLRNREELDLFLEQVSNPESPNYRSYVSATEFVERFGPAQQDYDKLIEFVQANGFAVSGTHSNRMILDVTGPVTAVEKTFHVNMNVWEHPKRGQFIAPDRDPWLDTDVDVLDITGLDNFVLARPMDVKTIPLASATPMLSGSGPAGLLMGKDFRAAYAPGVTRTGAGQTVGLFELDGFYAADVTANFKQAGLPPVSVQTVLLDGFNGAPGGANIEVILDIMMAAYMAPGANIIVYEGYNWNDVLNRMATDNIAKQLSSSWCFSPINATTEQIFKQMIAQGQSLLQASGDSGAYSGWIMPPADNPNVTVVGGTALTTTGPGGSWLSETTWSGSGGGVSTTYAIPSYQQSINMAALGGSNTMRNIPDVALTAAVQMFLICNNGQWISVGGTSAAAPLWAGFAALANEQAAANGKPAVGFLNPFLYTIGAGSKYSSDLHDITSGANGHAAIPGFDLATGWGTPTGQPLMNDLTSMPSVPSFTLSAAPGTVSAQVGSSTTSAIQITALSGFSGSVVLSASGLPAGVTGTFSAVSSSGASTLTLAASSGAAPGSYPISIHGISGTLTANAGLTLQVTGTPGYSLKASVAAVSVTQGGAGTASITVAPTNGFAGTVNLAVSGLPSGVTASFSPAATATASTLTFTASATAAAGTTAATVTGTSGSLSATVTISLTVAPTASFSLIASAPTLSVVQGAGATNTITVTPKNGFNSKVNLAVSGLPNGVTASFNPAATATTSIVTFSATSAAATGTNPVIVTGTAGTSSASVTISLTVKGAPGFTLGAAPSALSITQGASGNSTLAVTPVNGFTGAASLAISGLPTGVTATFSPASTGSTSTLTLTSAASAPTGAATLGITATSGAITAKATLSLTVASAPGFTLSASTPSLSVIAGSAGSATIGITPRGGFNAAVAFAAAGLPAGVTASFTPASTNTTSTLTLTVAGTTTPGTSQVTVKGASGTLTASVTVALTVNPPPDFAVALAPASLSVVEGGKGTGAISITPLNGFAGIVMLSASGLPAGVTASFNPIKNSVFFLGTFTVASSAVAGTSKVTVTAASGSISHSAVATLTVLAPSAGTAVADLSTFYNVSASALDTLPFTDGGLDSLGRSYSGLLLGASQTVGGTVFSLGPMGVSGAVSGQTVTLPARAFTTLKLLATGVNGNQANQTFTVTYTDGSTASFTESLSDWYTPQNYTGETRAVTTNYRDNSTGTTDGRIFYLYGYSFTLNSAKMVSSISLPKNRNVVVLAITLAGSTNLTATAQVDLSKVFNGIGIVSDTKPFTGGLDGVGYAYSGALLQGVQTFNTVQFQLGPAGQADVVSGSATIPLPAGKYSNLVVLATAVNGAQLSQPFKILYSDGTNVTFTQSLSDWFTPANYSGELTAVTMPYRNAQSGARDNRTFRLYQYVFNLDSTRTPGSLVVPASSNVKVFAITLKP